MIIRKVAVQRAKHPRGGTKALQTAVVLVEAATPNGVITGVGEIRASERHYHESLGSACDLMRAYSSILVGQGLEFDAGSAVAGVAGVVTAATREALQLGDVPLGRFVHRPSRFALEVALLDLLSQASSMPLAAFLGARGQQDFARVRRNVEGVPAMPPKELYGAVRRTNLRGKWLRVPAAGRPAEALARLQVIHDAGSASGNPAAGVWLDLAGSWHPHDAAAFVDECVRRFDPARSIPVLLQDPLAHAGDELRWLGEKLSELRREPGRDIRLLVADPVWGLHSLDEVADILRHADLAICPQRAGGVAEVMGMAARFRQLNECGRIMVHTLGQNTELNTVTLAHLSAAIPEASYFGAKLRRASTESDLSPRPRISDGAGFDFFGRPGLGCAPVSAKSILQTAA